MQTCLGLLIVMWCSSSEAPTKNLTFCDGYTPVRMAHEDTRQTKEGVATNNAIYKEKCMVKK